MAAEAGTDRSRAPRPGAGVAEAHARIRARVPFLAEDREPGPDMAALLALVREGGLADLVD
jgi:histidine ammonia-lyase